MSAPLTTVPRPPIPTGTPSAPPVTVTVQVTIPGGEDTMTTAARLAEHLHALTSVATTGATPTADVSTTVSVVVDQTASHPAVHAREPAAAARAGGLAAVQGIAPEQTSGATSRRAPLRIDTVSRHAVLAGAPLALTRREYDLLLFLAGHPGRVFTRPQLLKWVWGYDIVSGERTVDVHIRRLRRKLRQQGPTITTVRGVGYRLDGAGLVDVVE